MDNGYLDSNDLTNIKITPIMGFVDIVRNLKYLFNLRLKIKEIVDTHLFTHIFFVDSFDFSKFYIQKFKSNKIKYCQIVGPSVFIWKSSKAKFINRNFDKIFSIFSVEKRYYNSDIYDYIGHPLKNKTYYSNDYNEIRSKFEELGRSLPSVLPISFADTIWDREEMQKAKVFFDNDKRKRMTLSPPKDYSFYDDSFGPVE